ncbi:MAG: ABC transporter ATP-binding protein [Thermoplasmata archaeon]|nr:ABC transporter ATP-binding protein [Thermoplasmata archaeon]
MPDIKIENLKKVFGDLVAIDNLSLEVKDGEYLTILGPTGAGKTTLLRLIAGLTKQTSGSISINGERVDKLPPEERKVTFLSQSYSLFPHMNVWDNTIFGPIARGWEPEKVNIIGREMLEMVHLYDRKDAMPNELSGGMQQRNALARALCADAKILLLDEPLRALDARLRLDLRYELKKLVKDMGMTAIHVTHDQEEALTISDRIIMLKDGKVIQSDKPHDMFNKPASPFIHHFIGEANFVKGKITKKSNNDCQITDSIGRIYTAAKTSQEVGANAVAGIKTEFTVIEKEQKDQMNTFRGTVDRKLFLGRFTDFEIILTDGGIVHARLPSSIAHKFVEGSQVYVHYSPERLLVFPEPEKGLKAELEMM